MHFTLRFWEQGGKWKCTVCRRLLVIVVRNRLSPAPALLPPVVGVDDTLLWYGRGEGKGWLHRCGQIPICANRAMTIACKVQSLAASFGMQVVYAGGTSCLITQRWYGVGPRFAVSARDSGDCRVEDGTPALKTRVETPQALYDGRHGLPLVRRYLRYEELLRDVRAEKVAEINFFSHVGTMDIEGVCIVVYRCTAVTATATSAAIAWAQGADRRYGVARCLGWGTPGEM